MGPRPAAPVIAEISMSRTLHRHGGVESFAGGLFPARLITTIDLARGRIEVSEAVTDVNGQMVFGTPKSHHARWLPVPRFLRVELAEQVAGKGFDDLVFPSPQGSVLRVQNFRRRCFDRAATQVGLAGLVPHELRHTAASLAIASTRP
jgi:integrase